MHRYARSVRAMAFRPPTPVSRRCFAVYQFLNAEAAAAAEGRATTSFPSRVRATIRGSNVAKAAVGLSALGGGGGGGSSNGGGGGAAMLLAAGSLIGWAKGVAGVEEGDADDDTDTDRPPTPVLQAMLDAEKALAKEDLRGAEANYHLALDRMREFDPGAEVVVVLHDRRITTPQSINPIPTLSQTYWHTLRVQLGAVTIDGVVVVTLHRGGGCALRRCLWAGLM